MHGACDLCYVTVRRIHAGSNEAELYVEMLLDDDLN